MKKLNNIFLAILICFTFAVLNINQVSAERGTSGNTSISNNSHVKKSGDRSKDYKNGGRESGGELSQGKKYEEAKEQIEENRENLEEKNIESIKEWGNQNQQRNDISNIGNCDVIGGETRTFLNKIFNYISIIGIIIVVVMSMIDGIKVITASEDGAMGNFLKGLRVRAICLILLLILPMLVTFVVSTINNVANIAGVNSNNPLCGVK